MSKLLRKQEEQPKEEFEDEIPEEGEREEAAEKNFEEEFEINTIADFIMALKSRHDEIEDTEMKKNLANQINKIESALSASGLSGREIKVIEMPDGVLGTYTPLSGQISASEDMLADFSSDERLFRTVFIHERTHKEGIEDEGLTQLSVEKETSATPGIYRGEKEKAKRTFYTVGIDKALNLYNIDNPERLAGYFLKVELKRKYGGKHIKSAKLDSKSREEADRLKGLLKDGAEELTKKLGGGYDFKERAEEILKDYVKEL